MQVSRIQELLKRGLGVHHSGVLPIIKEVSHLSYVCSGLDNEQFHVCLPNIRQKERKN